MIDLSVAIEQDAPGELTPPKIQYVDHTASAGLVAMVFGCKPEDLVYS